MFAKKITRPLSQVTQFEYDGQGRLTKTIDPGGIAECRESDAANLLTAVVASCVPGQPSTVSQNVRTEYGYGRRGLLTSLTDPLSHQRTRGYNAAGWQTTSTDALNRTTAHTYDRAGWRLTVADPRPVTVMHAYDSLDQRLSEVFSVTGTWLVGDRLGGVRAEYNSGGTLTASPSYEPFEAPGEAGRRAGRCTGERAGRRRAAGGS